MRVGQNENTKKALFDWFKRMRMNNLPIIGSIVKEKAINYAQELQAEEFHASNWCCESWKARFNVSLKVIVEKENTVISEITIYWWETHLLTILSRFELKDIHNAVIYNI